MDRRTKAIKGSARADVIHECRHQSMVTLLSDYMSVYNNIDEGKRYNNFYIKK